MSAPVRWSASWDIGIRAWCWSLVTVPAVAMAAMVVGTVVTASSESDGPSAGAIATEVGGLIVVSAFLDIVAAVIGFGSALVALPLTHLLEIALRRVPGARTHAVLHACLAGVLACVPAAFGPDGFSLAWLAALAVAAGTAAALAVRGADLRRRTDADREARLGPAAEGTTPERRIPTGPPPSLQTGELP